MSHVLVSYKREDEPRVAVLVRALRANGLEVWWDQALPSGESWRANIQAALDQAGCVVVVLSHGITKEREVPDKEIENAVKHKRQVSQDFARYAVRRQ